MFFHILFICKCYINMCKTIYAYMHKLFMKVGLSVWMSQMWDSGKDQCNFWCLYRESVGCKVGSSCLESLLCFISLCVCFCARRMLNTCIILMLTYMEDKGFLFVYCYFLYLSFRLIYSSSIEHKVQSFRESPLIHSKVM